MKRVTIILFSLFLTLTVKANESLPQSVRNQFIAATQDKGLRANLVSDLSAQSKNVDKQTALFTKAYLGASKTLLAETSNTPWTKYSLFKEGTELIDAAILQDPRNAEFRYLRFVVQINAPEFLGYNTNLSEDFNFLKKSIDSMQIPSEWVAHFLAFEKKKYDLIKSKLAL